MLIMKNYMNDVADMLGVKLDENFKVYHKDGCSVVKLMNDGIHFVDHLGRLKEDAPAICLNAILKGEFKIEYINR